MLRGIFLSGCLLEVVDFICGGVPFFPIIDAIVRKLVRVQAFNFIFFSLFWGYLWSNIGCLGTCSNFSILAWVCILIFGIRTWKSKLFVHDCIETYLNENKAIIMMHGKSPRTEYILES